MKRRYVTHQKLRQYEVGDLIRFTRKESADDELPWARILGLVGEKYVPESNSYCGERVTNHDEKYSKPTFVSRDVTAYWFHMDGEALLRLGGYRQRQQGILVSPCEVVKIEGGGKRALEGLEQGSFMGYMVEIIPIVPEVAAQTLRPSPYQLTEALQTVD